MATRSNLRRSLVVLLAGTLAGCGGGESPDASGSRSSGAASSPAAGAPASSEAPAGDPAELARQGEEIFQQKGCNACHKFGGGRLVGPDLVGVTERRDRAWIEAMIVNPDSMLRNDSTAKALLAEYYTPMQDVGVTPEEAGAIYHYLRRQTEQAETSGS